MDNEDNRSNSAFENENQHSFDQPNEGAGQSDFGVQQNEFDGQQNEFSSEGNPSGEFNSQQNTFDGQQNVFNNQQNVFNNQQNAFNGQQNYGAGGFNGNYGMGQMPLDRNGQPVKNRFGMKIVFAILEILTIFGCNVITFIFGIIAAVFTSKANTSYQQGRWDDYKSQARTAAVLLWVGLAGFILEAVIIVLSLLMGISLYNEATEIYSNNQRLPKEYQGSRILDDTEEDTNTENAQTSEENTEVKEMTPSNVIPGQGFTDPSFTVNGVAVTLPLDYADLKELGFYINTEDEDYYMNKNEYFYPDLYDAVGNEIGYVYIGNVTEGAMPMKEGLVFGIEFSNDLYVDIITDVVLSSGVTFASTKEELITAYGEPDYEYESESYDSCEYTWYSHSEEYYDSSENSIEFSYWEGAMDSITIRYIGWE